MFYNRKGTPRCDSYKRAVELFEKFSLTPTGRARKPNHLGFMPMNSKVMGVRMDTNGDVIFRLHATDVVTWHPNNSFSIEVWESVSTADFIRSLTPISVGVNMVATVFTEPRESNDWRTRWATAIICHAEATFVDVGDHHMPDETTLRTFRYPEADRKLTRELSKEHRLAAFETWLAVAPHHLDLAHEGEDMEAVAKALKAGKFMEAAVHLPTIEVPRGFGIADRIKPIPMSGLHWQHPVTPASVQRFRRWLYDDGGAVEMRECKTMTQTEYDRRVKEISAFDKAGASLHRPGFRSW